MLSTPNAFLKSITLAGAFVVALPQLAMAQTLNRDSGAPLLQGTWKVDVTVRNCQTNAALGAPFLSLLTFAQGGTLTETTSNPLFFPAERGPGHGVWSPTGNGTYRASSVALVTVNGALTSLQTITQTIVTGPTPDKFVTSAALVAFLKPDGSLIRKGCATAVGTRFK